MAKTQGKHAAPRHAKPSNGSNLTAVIAAAAVLIIIIFAVVFIKSASAKKTAQPDETPQVISSDTTQPPAETQSPEQPDIEEETGPVQLYDKTQEFTITCIGDNTLWSSIYFEESTAGLPRTVGENYAYPYSATAEYFLNDELTISNLENTFADKKLYSAEQFYFKAPTKYVNIFLEGGVDFVTTANNHMMDFGDEGAQLTYEACEEAGLAYGKELEAQIITTPNNIKVGIVTAGTDLKPYNHTDEILAGIEQLKQDGADFIICMFHWGKELYYTPADNAVELAHKCIDAGANLIYGSHPHCLQPIEEYNGGIILYSVGNWVFGGNTAPTDPDTAIIQVNIERDVYGNVSYKSFNAIPCCVSGKITAALNKYDNYNDYCPTPYPEDYEAYERVISKLKGTYEATSQGKDYSSFYASWG